MMANFWFMKIVSLNYVVGTCRKLRFARTYIHTFKVNLTVSLSLISSLGGGMHTFLSHTEICKSFITVPGSGGTETEWERKCEAFQNENEVYKKMNSMKVTRKRRTTNCQHQIIVTNCITSNDYKSFKFNTRFATVLRANKNALFVYGTWLCFVCV